MTATAVANDYLAALRGLPLLAPEALLAGRPLVVVAPHPDDESLGLGGIIAAAQVLGAGVTVVFLTDGEASHVGSPTFPPGRLAMVRRTEASAALDALGVSRDCAHFLGLGDTRLSGLSGHERVEAIRRLQALVPPAALVCVTAPTDPHGDHQAASALVHDIPWGPGVDVMAYPVWTWNASAEDLPAHTPHGFRIEISPFLAMKRNAIAAHRSQHGGVIRDAREAFELSPVFVERFLATTETLLWPA